VCQLRDIQQSSVLPALALDLHEAQLNGTISH